MRWVGFRLTAKRHVMLNASSEEKKISKLLLSNMFSRIF